MLGHALSVTHDHSSIYPLPARRRLLVGRDVCRKQGQLCCCTPLTLAAIRLAIGIVPLWLILHRAGETGVSRPFWSYLPLRGLIAMSLGTQFVGTDLASAASGATLTVTTPALVVSLGSIVLWQRLSRFTWLGIGVSLAGAAVIVTENLAKLVTSHLVGQVLLLVSGLCWALYSIFGTRQAERTSALAVTTYGSAFSLLFMLPFVPLELQLRSFREFSLAVVGAVLYLGLGATVLGWYLWIRGPEVGGSGAGAAYFLAQPLVGGLLGWLVLGETLSVQFLVGAATIVGVMILVTARPDVRNRHQQSGRGRIRA